MKVFYVDSSAWIKRFCLEDGSDRVARFFAAGPTVGCSALGLVEVLCTLTRKEKAGEMDGSDVTTKCREAERDFSLFYKVFLTPALLRDANVCARRHALRGADTVHLASCLEWRRRMAPRGAVVAMVSCDAELLDGARQCGMETYDPEVEPVPT
jgi:predicted nucleic acid-binding protein